MNNCYHLSALLTINSSKNTDNCFVDLYEHLCPVNRDKSSYKLGQMKNIRCYTVL